MAFLRSCLRRRFNHPHVLAGFGLCLALLSGHGVAAESERGYVGISVARGADPNCLEVSFVSEKSPAETAGIKKGDCVSAIDGISTQGMLPQDAIHAINGPVGSTVELTLHAEGSHDRKFAVSRRSTLDVYLTAATAGDPSAESTLGYFYLRGPEATRDPVKAVDWYRMAAQQGYAIGEANLGYCYLRGEGIRQSDADAFKWFYSAARQDDGLAEEHLGFLYRTGRGVTKDNRAAFAWYYRSALRNDFDGEWNLGYMYEYGLGVVPDNVEALKWYVKAGAARPEDDSLKKTIAVTTLKVFLDHAASAPKLDLSLILSAFRREILNLFYALTFVYLGGMLGLFYFTFRTDGASARLSVAIAWMALYVESQGVAFFALCLLGSTVNAGVLIGVTALFCAMPVIISSCGPERRRIWRKSPASWRSLLFYGMISYAAIALLGLGYEKIYTFIASAPVPPQPTLGLISKAKDASLWLAYPTVALLLPVAEEIIFRGYLFDALRRRFSGRITVILTAIAFSAIHFQLIYAAPLFGFGLVLGWARQRADSLRLPVALHILNNGLFLAFRV